MKTLNIEIIRDVFEKNERVVFAYLYGSCIEGEGFRDVDLAVYSSEGCDAFQLSADLKVALHENTEIPPDLFDIRVINSLLDRGDIFSLLYLKQIFEKNELLLDKEFDTRTDFIEKYNMKYRECEGLLDEVLL
jgi:predicted nucleotidyltransferase